MADTTFTAAIIIFAVLLAVALVFLIRAARASISRTEARRDIEEFVALFPGRCPICSFHRYGLQHGHVTGKAPAHRCPEGNG